jgi:heme exporter protein D
MISGVTIALFSRRPQLRLKPKESPIIPADRDKKYPALAADLTTIDEVVVPTFSEFDLNAQRAQNRYWAQQVVLIGVTALTTAFGSVQAAYSHQVWPGVVVAVLGVLSAAVAGLGEERAAQRTYLDERNRAERLRSAAFAYLAKLPPYTGDDRERRLELGSAVADIAAGREPK